MQTYSRAPGILSTSSTSGIRKGSHTDTHRHTHTQTHTHTHTQTDRQTDRQTHKHTHTHRHTHRHTHTDTDRQTDTRTHTHTHIYTHTESAAWCPYFIVEKELPYFVPEVTLCSSRVAEVQLLTWSPFVSGNLTGNDSDHRRIIGFGLTLVMCMNKSHLCQRHFEWHL